MDDLTSTVGAVALAAAAVAAIALLLAVWHWRTLRRLRAAQLVVLGAYGQRDLVEHASGLQRDFEALHAFITDAAERLDRRVGATETRLDGAVTRVGLVRYDAYNEMSGRQSTSIALLDDRDSGVVLSSIHHREQARMYAKQVSAGKGELQLSPEEEEAVQLAATSTPAPEAAPGPRVPVDADPLGPQGALEDDAPGR